MVRSIKDEQDADIREALADWLASPKNPFFARTIVNRVWKHYMGRGLVEEVDDFRVTNPPTHPALLDALAADLIAHKFDMRHLIRTILNSRAYQLSATPNDSNRNDALNYSHFRIRRLTAETLAGCHVASHRSRGEVRRLSAWHARHAGLRGRRRLHAVELWPPEPRHYLRTR